MARAQDNFTTLLQNDNAYASRANIFKRLGEIATTEARFNQTGSVKAVIDGDTIRLKGLGRELILSYTYEAAVNSAKAVGTIQVHEVDQVTKEVRQHPSLGPITFDRHGNVAGRDLSLDRKYDVEDLLSRLLLDAAGYVDLDPGTATIIDTAAY